MAANGRAAKLRRQTSLTKLSPRNHAQGQNKGETDEN